MNTNTNTNNTRHAKSYSHSTSECDANIRGISNAMPNSGFSINMNLKQNADSENNLNINQLSNHELLGRLERLVKSERKITHRVLLHINEVEQRRLYADLGFDSMFKYLTQNLGYSEDSAYRRLQAARLLNNAPQLAEKLESGALNLTQLTQVQKCIKQEHQEGRNIDLKKTQKILEKIENKSNYETQKLLAHEFNLPIKSQEIIMPQRDDSVRLEVTFTQSEMEILLKAKQAISHSVPSGNWAQVFTYLAKKHLQKEFGKKGLEVLGISESLEKNKDAEVNKNQFGHDKSAPNSNILITDQAESGTNDILKSKVEVEVSPLVTRNFMVMRKGFDSQFQSGVNKSNSKLQIKSTRKPIKISIKRELLTKAGHCCQYVDSVTGKKCDSTYQLQIDHRVPLAKNGSHDILNLQVLCRTHNLHLAQKWGLL